ncbi:Predicted acetyltransferase [Actinacidiphila yanglinensis]|uniref:Predicted acetyltransferase n=1 Tax=Actinacidiphila yanglinensis TaxID=310779 RepID=A0A1H6DMR2_9ACTN|nr:GNAT family N-acetyltransferase [Actinacidiphila yanglinensis]SEG86529.1 Predicted acetyltransferase [Actinacidiphila yanglinensis]
MTIELRGIGPDQWDPFFDMVIRAFHSNGEAVEERAMWRGVIEFDRITSAWDGDELVGSAGLHSFRMTVPGGDLLPVAGVTMVTVQPTHTRRGILTSMMRRQLDSLHEGGESVAVLTASEPAIYGRFGYGVATQEMHGRVDSARAGFTVPDGADGIRLRLVDVADPDVLAACEAVYARLVPGRAGMLARQPGWEKGPILDAPATRGGSGPLLCVLAETGGEVRGYARYAVARTSGPGGPASTVNLRNIGALDPVTYAALWRYLASIDLTAAVAFDNLAIDDPLLHLVADQRRCELGFLDGLHLRLVDVGPALAARAYSVPVDVVLDVADAFCPWNAGRWRLTGDAKGATCERTDDPADLALDVKELGAAYLGGPTLRAMAGAGLVRELRPGALAETCDAFRTAPAPWLPHGF